MKSVLLTCGIGDFIAMESHFTRAEREDVEVIHWASRAREALMSLVPFVFPNVRQHIVERDTWGAAFTKTFCISSRKELPNLDPAVADWSVKIIVDEAKRGKRGHVGSSIVKQPLCNISHLGLPEKYFVVHPYSENARTPVRDMTADEWSLAHMKIRSTGAQIVIVNKGGERFNRFTDVIDLTDQLTLLEAIEVTKGGIGFVGAASLFSVVAAKTMPSDHLFIKGSTDLKRNYFWFYYAPHATNSFINESLLRILPNVPNAEQQA